MLRQYSQAVVEDRFWSKVDKRGPDDCWPWLAGKYSSGYGAFQENGTAARAHRTAFRLANGSIDADLLVLHSCEDRYPPGDVGSRSCCNPAHLGQGTNAENMRQMAERGRAASGDRSFARQHPERMARGARNGAFTHPETRTIGERNVHAKLTENDVRRIRLAAANREVPRHVLAAQFNVTESTLSKIVLRQTWTHVPDAIHGVRSTDSESLLTRDSLTVLP